MLLEPVFEEGLFVNEVVAVVLLALLLLAKGLTKGAGPDLSLGALKPKENGFDCAGGPPNENVLACGGADAF